MADEKQQSSVDRLIESLRSGGLFAPKEEKAPAEPNWEGMNQTRSGLAPYQARVSTQRPGARVQDADPWQHLGAQLDLYGGAAHGYVDVAPVYDDRFLYSLSTRSPAFIGEIQYALLASGLIDPKSDYIPNVMDSVTQSAMSKVLGYANRAGVTWEQALEEMMQGGMERMSARSGGGGARGPVFTPRLSNPDDLKKLFRQTAYNMLGGQFIADDQQQAFVDAYHQIELGAQRAAFDAQVGGGGTVVDAPNPSTTAQQQVEEIDPMGVKAKRINDYASMFERLIGGM